MMDVGRVEYYNQDRGFGYLSHHKNSEDVYFDQAGYCEIKTINDNPEQDNLPIFAEAILSSSPKQGEWVLFDKKHNHQGPYARKWGYASQKPGLTKYIGQEIEMSYRLARPSQPYFRVRYQTKIGIFSTFWLGNRANLASSLNRSSQEYGDSWWLEVKDSPRPWRKISIEDVDFMDKI